MVVLNGDADVAVVFIFIFRASKSGFEDAAAVDVLMLLLGLGSRLMTGMVVVDVLGKGAARRLLRVGVMEGIVEEGAGVEVGILAAADFSGSGAKWKQINMITK